MSLLFICILMKLITYLPTTDSLCSPTFRSFNRCLMLYCKLWVYYFGHDMEISQAHQIVQAIYNRSFQLVVLQFFKLIFFASQSVELEFQLGSVIHLGALLGHFGLPKVIVEVLQNVVDGGENENFIGDRFVGEGVAHFRKDVRVLEMEVLLAEHGGNGLVLIFEALARVHVGEHRHKANDFQGGGLEEDIGDLRLLLKERLDSEQGACDGDGQGRMGGILEDKRSVVSFQHLAVAIFKLCVVHTTLNLEHNN